jgi:hypothetical protein
MFVGKVSNPDDDDGMLRKVECIILNKLASYYNDGITLIGYQELKDRLGAITSENFDTALEELIAQALIPSPDGETYEITGYGIDEYKHRKTERTLF